MKNIILAVVALIAIAGLFTPVGTVVTDALGNKTASFWDVADGYKVDGTLVIDGSGNFDGAVTASSLNYLESNETVTADNTLTASESGKVFYISGAASTSTLPAVATATGTVFTFVASGSITGDITVVSAEGDNIEGAVDVNSSIVTVDAADRVLFAQSAENLGDVITIRSNGQKWYVDGTALNAAGLSSDG